MGKLILLFTVVPIVELWLLLSIGDLIGFWPTVALALGTAILGAALGKREGLKVLAAWRGAMTEGRIPDEGLTGGLLVLLGAALLITPGVLTDVAGILLLLPPARRRIAALVRARLEHRMAASAARVAASAAGFGGDGPGAGAFFSMRVVDLGGGPFGGRSGAPSWRPPTSGQVIDVEAAEVTEEDARGGPLQPSTRRLPR